MKLNEERALQTKKLGSIKTIKSKLKPIAVKHLQIVRSRNKRKSVKMGGAAGAALRKMWGLEDAIAAIARGMPLEEAIEMLLEKKKHQTPKFVQHCVSAVRKKEGYPVDKSFAICYSQRNKGKAKGKDYEKKHSKEHTPSNREEFEKSINYKGVK